MSQPNEEAFATLAGERRSVKQYDPAFELGDETLQRLFAQVVLSPSSFNLQHWRFVVVRSLEHKQALRAAAFGQPQVEAASAVVVVCGKLSAYADTERIYAEAPAEIQERMSSTIQGLYAENPQLQRDEAIRSGSLAAMSLMLAAQAMGLATGPMIGFDPQKVGELIELPTDHVPVMLIVLGKQTGTLRPRMSRLPLAEVVKLERFSGAGL